MRQNIFLECLFHLKLDVFPDFRDAHVVPLQGVVELHQVSHHVPAQNSLAGDHSGKERAGEATGEGVLSREVQACNSSIQQHLLMA